MAIQLAPLPYSPDALAPHLSAETLSLHHDKHHRAYVDKTNALIKGKPEDKLPLERLVMTAEAGPLFNNAAQAWNHAFYWNSMKPKGGGEPRGAVASFLARDFGSYRDFREQFVKTSVEHFGSGWTWLVSDAAGRLSIVAMHDAKLPQRVDPAMRPLLNCDLWEHAYYVDYRNERPKYVEAFLDHLLNWDWVALQLETTV